MKMKNLITVLALIIATSSFSQKALDSYLPVLESTLKRGYKVDRKKGFYVKELKPNVFLLAGGGYEMAVIVTSEGVVLIDAPESLGPHIIKAVKEVTNQPIVTLVYTHGHIDHIGGSNHLKDIKNLEIIALDKTARFIESRNDPRRLVPTTTFNGAYVITKGDKQIHLSNHINYHSDEGDLIVSIPQDKFLMAIDVVSAGWVPARNFNLSSNVHNFLNVFDQILAYDFDVMIGGHSPDILNRKDVEIAKEYAFDVYNTVKRIHDNLDPMTSYLATAKAIGGFSNGFLLFKEYLAKVSNDSADEIIARWSKRLAGVDVFAGTHTNAMLTFVRWDD